MSKITGTDVKDTSLLVHHVLMVIISDLQNLMVAQNFHYEEQEEIDSYLVGTYFEGNGS